MLTAALHTFSSQSRHKIGMRRTNYQLILLVRLICADETRFMSVRELNGHIVVFKADAE